MQLKELFVNLIIIFLIILLIYGWLYYGNNLFNNYNNIFTNNTKNLEIEYFNENISHNFVPKKNPPGKTVWLLWLQGWNNAPWYIHKIKESWIKYNPDWNIELVSEENLSDYINIKIPINASHDAISNIIRLNLLYTHGGVWADSTMVCMMPLDLWVYDVLQPSGFWMYHGPNTNSSDTPSSWFIISMKHNYLITQWRNSCNNYWENRISAHQYFWMDELFMNLINTDSIFTNMWRNTPYLNSEDEGQAYMLAGKCLENDTNLIEILHKKPPFAVKLSRHGAPDEITEEFKKTNMYFAIDCALNRTNSDFILPNIIYKPYINIFNKDKVLVVADCNNGNEILELNIICNENDIQMIIYDKCNFGKHVSSELYCRPLKNVGREQSTYVYFVINNYEYLPNIIYLLPGNIHKHNRIGRFVDILKNNNDKYNYCSILDGQQDFILNDYEGVQLKPASIRPFKKWFEKYVGEWDNNMLGPCWNGIMQTNKDRILRHSKDYYYRLYNDINVYNNGEVAHYAERSMAAIF